MGFLSSLFGSSKSAPATTTNVVQQKLAPEIAPFAKEVLTDAQALYKSNIERGYDPYTGQTIAPLTPEQEQAMAGISGLVGTSRPLQEEALATYRQGGDQFTGDVAEQYMSPYQQAVTDIELREAQRRFEGTTMPKLEAQAIGMGGMSGLGSRAGVEMAEAQRSQNQLLADIQAKGSQSAYTDARKGFEAQQARERQMAGDVATLAPAMFSSGLQEQGALQSVGEQKQQLGQSALDESYYKFLEEQQYPQQQLANYSGFVYGNPAAGLVNQTGSGTQTPFQPSFGSQLLGAGLQLGGAYLGSNSGGRAATNYMKNNLFSKTGGGISSLLERANGGGLGEDEQGFPAETPENITQFTEEVEAPVPAAQVGKDRTEVIKNLALQGGSFPGIFTPEEVTQQAEEKKSRRAAVMEQIMQGKGQLTLGGTLMALGQGISGGGGLKIGEALKEMTDQLMAERKDLSKLEAQNLLANLDIDELAIDTIRKLPKQIQLILAARKKSKQESDYMEAKTKKLNREGGPKPSKRLPVDLSKRPDLINQGDRILKRKTEELLKGKNLSGAEINFANRLGDLDNESQQNFFARVYEINRLAGDGKLEESVDQAMQEAYDRMKKMGPDTGLDERNWWTWD